MLVVYNGKVHKVTRVKARGIAAPYYGVEGGLTSARLTRDWATLREAAEYLGVTPDTLRQQIANGKLAAEKVGRDWHVSCAEIERYEAVSRRKATTPTES